MEEYEKKLSHTQHQQNVVCQTCFSWKKATTFQMLKKQQEEKKKEALSHLKVSYKKNKTVNLKPEFGIFVYAFPRINPTLSYKVTIQCK